jgi:diguanylate cyclase (GGDEF)-like protein
MWQSIQETGFWNGELWNRRKNGEVYPEWLHITSVKINGVLSHYIGTMSDITEYKTAEAQIHKLAFYDPLTGLPNRRLLQERLQHAIERTVRDRELMALLMLDLDHFKPVNDSLGHLAGDQLLQQVAKRLSNRVRNSDMTARLGGDEFTVLLENIIHIDDAANFAQEIINSLSEPFYLDIENKMEQKKVRIGVSIGISLFDQHDKNKSQTITPQLLMDNADIALYKAKDSGRNCFAYFSEELTLAANRHIELESIMRGIIERNELLVHYQPQIDIATDKIIGAEALIRWQNSNGNFASPWHFICFAEESGFIAAIGEWILHETCRQGKQWLDAGLPALKLAVNVSPHQFSHNDNDMVALVTKVLEETQFPAQFLELELTESGLMKNHEKTCETLDNLRKLGVSISIDDFGTGYSSLAYLKYFPVSKLKIDKGFIDDIPKKEDDMVIVETIISMGHTLGFKVLAEGVETMEQLEFLRKKGCNEFQGYLRSKPLPADEFECLLKGQIEEKQHR